MPTIANKPLVIHKPGDKDYCPSCDKAGLAILVTLFGVIPTQNYAKAAAHGYDWVSYMEPDSSPMFGSFDRRGYLAARKLSQSATETRLNCSHYVVRRLRKGYLYVYYPQDKTWNYYATQINGRLERMQGDLHHGLGRSDAACARFTATPSNLLLTIDDPQRHAEFWIAFSEAPWTQAVRNQVAASPGEFMRHVNLQQDLVAFDGADLIKGTVFGFQEKPLPHGSDRLAYPCASMDSPEDTYQALVAHNTPFKATGLMLALEDDIGITTQLAFERNGALLDIVGEGAGYTEDDRNKMDTAGLFDQLRGLVGDEQFARMQKHLKPGAFDTYLAKYNQCRDARTDFSNYSHDYTLWMQHTLERQHWKLFDPAVPEIGAHLGRCTANLFEGCGLTKEEFDKVLKPQLEADANAPTQLFWRGAAGNNHSLLALLTNTEVGKSLLEGIKKHDETSEQVTYLTGIRKAKVTAAELNKASWSRLARVIASHSKQLHTADAKAFRRTMRRVQALTLTDANQMVIEYTVQGSAAAYLKQIQLGMNKAAGTIRRTPKNAGEMAALAELMVAMWKPGEPAPPDFLQAMKDVGVTVEELPPSTTIEVSEIEVKPAWLKATVGMNAGMATLQIMTFVESVEALGLDLDKVRHGDRPELLHLIRDLGNAGASLVGLASTGYETAAVLTQLAADGSKTTRFWQLTWTAGKVGLIGAGIQLVVGGTEATELWEGGDHGASIRKGGSALAGGLGSYAGYWGMRTAARAALEAAARKAALGAAGELAVGTEAAAAVTGGAALESAEVPPAAAVALIISVVLWGVSLGLDVWSRHFVTTPFEKWADRGYLGEHSGKWGRAYTGMQGQLEALLRLLYTVKVEQPSAFGLDNAMTVSVAAFGPASELDLEVANSEGRLVGHYLIHGTADGSTPTLENLARPQPGLVVHAQAEQEGGGLKVELRIGGADAKWLDEAKQLGLRVLVPAWGFFDTAHKLADGLPTAHARYYPDHAAYPWFHIEGGSEEKAAAHKDAAE